MIVLAIITEVALKPYHMEIETFFDLRSSLPKRFPPAVAGGMLGSE